MIDFVLQSPFMESNWAAENLQVIRTLMERSALYRRALGPVMIVTGAVGTIAGVLGWKLDIATVNGFVRFWVGVSLVALVSSFFLVRRQAIKDAEPLWSSPTRRVAQAMLPGLFIGGIATIPFLLSEHSSPNEGWSLIPVWLALYGCAVFSAGFFMPRGMKFFGWAFILSGSALYLMSASTPRIAQPLNSAHLVMGFFFGALHLAYGAYLHVTEKRKNAQ